MLRWSDFCFRLGILRNLVLRYFCPWDEYFFHPIVFDIWYLACNIDAVVDLANLSDQESLLLDEVNEMIRNWWFVCRWFTGKDSPAIKMCKFDIVFFVICPFYRILNGRFDVWKKWIWLILYASYYMYHIIWVKLRWPEIWIGGRDVFEKMHRYPINCRILDVWIDLNC